MTYREVARIGKCSTGAVSAEVRAMRTEMLAMEKVKAEQEALLPKLEIENKNKNSFESSGLLIERTNQGHIFNFESSESCIELQR